MKLHKKLFSLFIFALAILMFGCVKKDEFNPNFNDFGQKMYLYGEIHAEKKILEEELKHLEKHYAEGVRDVFIESSYAKGEFLNIWMKEKDDKILDDLILDAGKSFDSSENSRNFYKSIKEKFPNVFFTELM